jgi:hypothetical protein
MLMIICGLEQWLLNQSTMMLHGKVCSLMKPQNSRRYDLLTVTGYLVRCDRSWGWACTLAISHNASSNTTYGVCIDLREENAMDLIVYLERRKWYAENPLFVPILLARLYIRTTITINRRHNKDFYDIQTSMKTDD